MDRQTEQHWRDVIDAQEQSGGTIAAWCRARGINPKTMYWWRSELKRRAGRGIEAAEGGPLVTAPAFVVALLIAHQPFQHGSRR